MNQERIDSWNLAEYQSLRQEAVARIRFLHQTLTTSILLQVGFLVVGYILFYSRVDLTLYLLLIPAFSNFLTFNYQSNQMSLEAIGKYINESVAPRLKNDSSNPALEWDQYFSRHKAHYKFEAFFKVLPLLFPNLIPLAVLIARVPLSGWEIVLLVFDFALLVIMAESFRYKLRRVK